MTTKIVKQFWIQLKGWLNLWTSESIETDDNLSEVTALVQWTSIANSIAQLRQGNLEQIWKKVDKHIAWKEIKQLESPKDSLNYLEEASKESDPELQEKWANLLANWLTGITKVGRYIDILKQLSADEVRYLDKIYEHIQSVITKNLPRISELKIEITQIKWSLNTIYSEIWWTIGTYNSLRNSWDHQGAENLKNKEPQHIGNRLKEFEELQGKIPWLNIEIWKLEMPDFYIQELIQLTDLRELGEIVDNLKRLNLLNNANAYGIIMGAETLVTSNKFRLQLTDLWLKFIEACRRDN